MSLPISRIIIYKHGVGYFERRGPLTGEKLQLTFAREAMDDVLKSLVALDLGAGQVQSVDFETPEDRAAILERGSIHLSDHQSLLDLLRDLRGRQVALILDVEGEIRLEGVVVGVDYETDEPLRRALVSLYDMETHQVRALPVAELARVDLLDSAAVADLNFFLRAAQSEEDRRSATIHLSPGEHDLLVGYIAPAPAWRVSYRLLYEEPKEKQAKGTCLLQGWGIFDNQLDEDLEGVELTLVAGMPISFRYRLYEPHTPERPLVEDEERTVGAPIFFDAAPEPAPMVELEELSFGMAPPSPAMARAPMGGMQAKTAARMSIDDMAESVEISAKGDERGALFAYKVGHPVSVARGQSAMVPIVSTRLTSSRDLLYNKAKLPDHPVASLRLMNETGLTLERGPVTVLDDGDYAGEAVLPFTRAGGELIVPYAVELGIKVHEKESTHREMYAVRIERDYLIFEEYDIRTRTYEIVSGLDKPTEVMIEHPRLVLYQLQETRKPDEESPDFLRWRVPCPAHVQTTFTVTERRKVSHHEQIRSLSGARLHVLLENGLIDNKTMRFLEGILNLYRQITETQTEIRKVEQEREAIYKQQRQIQGNLQPLGREGDEGALRQRYVTTLNQLEDGLINLSKREEALKQQIANIEAKIKQQLGA